MKGDGFFFFIQPKFTHCTSAQPISTKFPRNHRNREHSDSIEIEFWIFLCGGRRVERTQNTENFVIGVQSFAHYSKTNQDIESYRDELFLFPWIFGSGNSMQHKPTPLKVAVACLQPKRSYSRSRDLDVRTRSSVMATVMGQGTLQCAVTKTRNIFLLSKISTYTFLEKILNLLCNF